MNTEENVLNLSGAKVLSGQEKGFNLKSAEETTEETQENNIENDVQEQSQEQAEEQNVEQAEEQVQEEVLGLDDEKVLKYLKEKKGFTKEELSFEEEKKQYEIPEEVSKFLEYKKETGRGFEDFLELQKDWKNENEDVVLAKYLKEKNPYFSDEDIKDELSDFSYDEDLDDESDIRKKNRKKKKLLNEALSYLESQKEKFKAPKEGSSITAEIPEDYKLAKKTLDEIEQINRSNDALAKEKQAKFLDETKKVFTEDFKGFDFDLGDAVVTFKPSEPSELIKSQSDINNFLAKFVNDQGELVDVKGYHKALSAAMNVDKLAKHFYEQGKADAISQDAKDSKNINFSGRKPMDNITPKKGLKVVESNQVVKFGFKK